MSAPTPWPDLRDKFLADLAGKVAAGRMTAATRRAYRSDLNAWGDDVVVDLDALLKIAEGWGAATTTRKRRWRTLRAVLGWATENGYDIGDVDRILRESPRPSPRDRARSRVAVATVGTTMTRIGAIWQAATRTMPANEQAVVWLALRAGVATSEIPTLTADALDRIGAQLWVRGSRARRVPVTPEGIEVLSAANDNPRGPLVARSVRPVTREWVRRVVHNAARAAGVESVKVADARRVLAAELLGRLWPLETVALIVGMDERALIVVEPVAPATWSEPALDLGGLKDPRPPR